MAEDEVQSKTVNLQSDDVFLNGESESSACNLLSPDAGVSRPVLPRRSSLVKDHTRRGKDRKKTVSFSSMPNEKPVVNGMNILNIKLAFFATALRHNLAHLGHKKLTFDCFVRSFVYFFDFISFDFLYILIQEHVIKAFYSHKINIIHGLA